MARLKARRPALALALGRPPETVQAGQLEQSEANLSASNIQAAFVRLRNPLPARIAALVAQDAFAKPATPTTCSTKAWMISQALISDLVHAKVAPVRAGLLEAEGECADG